MENSILIIDGCEQYSQMLNLSLTSATGTIKIWQAFTTQDAFSILAERSPDVCLVDYKSKAENGLDIVSELHEKHPSTIVILLSEEHNEESRKYGHRNDVHFLFNKSQEIEQIKDTVMRVL
jgi:two-component system, response regulator, stage 0 sporulation protein F